MRHREKRFLTSSEGVSASGTSSLNRRRLHSPRETWGRAAAAVVGRVAQSIRTEYAGFAVGSSMLSHRAEVIIIAIMVLTEPGHAIWSMDSWFSRIKNGDAGWLDPWKMLFAQSF
jgi:hypothetical protein